eukprot:2159045-Rhodomonas_salina.1
MPPYAHSFLVTEGSNAGLILLGCPSSSPGTRTTPVQSVVNPPVHQCAPRDLRVVCAADAEPIDAVFTW